MRARFCVLIIAAALTMEACGGEKTPLEKGRIDYLRTCATCHGAKGEGMARLGNRLRGSDFIRTRSDEEMIEFLKVGRPPSDPENESGMPMPPRGGDPRLTDEDLRDIVTFLRSLAPSG